MLVVGTYDADGAANVMTAAWGGVACSKPPCVSVSLRAATASHGNIMARRAFTISLPGEANAAQADYAGIVSGRDHDKFAELGLTAVRSDLVDAPYIAEFPLVLECKVVAVHELGLHTQFIGEIIDVKADESVLTDAGRPDLELLKPILFSMDPSAYYGVGRSSGQGVLDRQGPRPRRCPMNPTLELMNARCSTRAYADTPITDAEKRAILHTTMRAPTGGNMMLYSIIDVTDQALKDRLAVTCDDQPFIAKAPWVLVFVADMQKWVDLFRYSHVEELEGVEHRMTPGLGDLMLACSDALIAAQNAVVAAESLGIGSCYIGDILEQAETHAELLDLPQHTLPIAMLCFGRAAASRPPVPRYEKHVVHENAYQRLTDAELAEVSDGARPHGTRRTASRRTSPTSASRSTGASTPSDFMAEMNRSVDWWLERWVVHGGMRPTRTAKASSVPSTARDSSTDRRGSCCSRHLRTVTIRGAPCRA